jgi:hypothetical protein
MTMGNMQSMALAEAVKDGTATLRQALVIQVQSNFYPPLPAEYVDLGMQALADPNAVIQIPNDLEPKPRAAWQEPARTWEDSPDGSVWMVDGWTLINIMHLEPFMDEEE